MCIVRKRGVCLLWICEKRLIATGYTFARDRKAVKDMGHGQICFWPCSTARDKIRVNKEVNTPIT